VQQTWCYTDKSREWEHKENQERKVLSTSERTAQKSGIHFIRNANSLREFYLTSAYNEWCLGLVQHNIAWNRHGFGQSCNVFFIAQRYCKAQYLLYSNFCPTGRPPISLSLSCVLSKLLNTIEHSSQNSYKFYDSTLLILMAWQKLQGVTINVDVEYKSSLKGSRLSLCGYPWSDNSQIRNYA